MPVGPRIRSNNVYGTLSAPLGSSVVTDLTINSAELILLPNVTVGSHAVIVLDPKRVYGQPEIVIVTAHTGNATSATITRAAYSTTNRTHQAGTAWAHVTVDEDYTEILTSITRPTDPYIGQSIYETDTLSFRSYFSIAGGWNSSPPVGSLLPFLGAVAPDGYLLANGAAVSRTGITAALFGVVGTTYGVGDGVSTFNLPNLNGKVPVGRDATQGEFDVLGETGGAKTVTLTQGQIASHVHGVTDPTHNHGQTPHNHGNDAHDHGATTDDNNAGNHQHKSSDDGQGVQVLKTPAGPFNTGGTNGAADNWVTFDYGHTVRTSWSGDHNHDLWTDVWPAGINILGNYAWIQAASTGITINTAGNNEAHTNLQPYITVNYIVKI